MLFIGKLKTTSFNMAGKPSALALTIVFFAVFVSAVHGRLYRGADLVSDGVSNLRQPSFLTLNPFSSFSSSSDSCDQTYGVLPCTTTIIGNLFLIVVYGYLMFTGAKFLSGGSELLLEILGPGIVGGLFLPILGALPDALLILVSGLSGSTDEAQSQVSVGMGLLAGSTVMLLTLIWGSCVCVGKCDLQDSLAVDLQDTKGFNLLASGVSTDIWTSYAARIMAVSVIPFIIVQVPLVLSSSSGERLAILISLIVAVVLLITYCLYQVFQPWIQKRRLAYVKHKHVISGILRHLKMRSLGRLMTNDGRPNEEVIRKLFATIDEDKDNYLSAAELKALIVGIQFDEIDFDKDDAVKKVMQDFDTSFDNKLDSEEFVKGISKWLEEAKHSGDASRTVDHNTMKYLSDFDQQTKRERDRLGEDVGDQSDEVVGDQSDEVVEAVEDPKRITIKAVLMLLVGTVIAGVFADPLVDAVDDFSDATSIPAFFISFIALPLATNSSEAVSAIIFASRKNKRSASLTFSELYGAVTMNNVLCLAVFLALVYIRGLTWDFSSEVLIILIVCIVMGGFASFRITFPLWTSLLAFVLYPLSLALVYILDEFCGWS